MRSDIEPEFGQRRGRQESESQTLYKLQKRASTRHDTARSKNSRIMLDFSM